MTVYLVHAGVAAFAFTVMATLSSVYRFQEVGLTPLQLVLVGTVLEATVLLAELPTGVLADTVSRRLSLLVGTVLIGIGFVLEGLVPTLTAVLAAQVIWGVGAAFESGAVEAWLSDEIGERAASRAFLRAAQVQQAAALAGIPVAALGIASAEVARRGLDRADPDGRDRRPLVAVLLTLTLLQGSAVAAFVGAAMLLGPAAWLLGRAWRREPRVGPPVA